MNKPSKNASPLDETQADVGDRLGVLPNFFRLSPQTPEVTSNLWGFAKFGYVDNPLPSLFKERLFVYLSRFCEVRYCIARHVGFLLGLGHPAGDSQITPETLDEVVRLLRRPLPRGAALEPHLEFLEACGTPFAALPPAGSQAEETIFASATHVFLQTPQAARCLEALRRSVEERAFQHLLVLLAFVRTAHFWTKVHPELQQEDDIKELLNVHTALAEYVLHDPEAVQCETTQVLLDELATLRREKEQAALLRVTLASIGDAVITTDQRGAITFMNDLAAQLTGWTQAEALGKLVEEVFHVVNESDGTRIESPVQRVLRGGENVELSNHTLLIAKDGSRLPIDDSGSPIRVDERTIGAVLVFRDATDRRRQQKALEEQERQFRTLANSIPQLAWMAEPDGNIVWYNRRWYDYTGTTLAEMQGWGWQSVHDPNVLPEVIRRWKASLTGGESFEMVFPIKGVDGLFRPFLTRVHALKDDEGQVVRWFGTNTDIGEVKRSEDALREARSRLESTLAAAEIGTWEFDPVSNKVRADRNLARMFGVTTDEADDGPLESYFQAIHPEDRERVSQAIGQALERNEGYEADYRLVNADGSIRWVIARGRLERDTLTDSLRMPGVVVDVTSQREAEAEVVRLAEESERQRRLYDTVLSNSADFNYTFDLDGRFTYANKALLDLWGKSLAEAVGKNFFELGYPSDVAERFQQQIQQVIATRQPLRDETTYPTQQGERQFEYIFVPVIGASSAVEAVAGSTRDITQQKRIEEELRQVAARLSEADRRKDEFLATLAHELRNPLAPIRTGLEVMKYAQEDPQALEEIRSTMERQAQQMVRLIDDLLDVSRITQGKMELRTCQVTLEDVVQSAVEATQPFIDEAAHELTVSLPARPVLLNADPNRLTQVFANLLNNSVKYTPENGHIWLTAECQDEHVVVTVKDDGLGIPAEMQSGIFEMFTQIDRPLEKGYKGLGIGLTLVKRLVEMHGGHIEVHSEGSGRGSAFAVRLPILPETLHPASTIATATANDALRLRVLVVDDNLDAANMLSLVVKMLGNEVRSANDGLQAVAAAEQFKPDVILMDIGMPHMNGYEAAQHIRQQNWGDEVVLVALTGWGQEEDKLRASQAGFDYHMVKPAEPAALQQLLAGIRS